MENLEPNIGFFAGDNGKENGVVLQTKGVDKEKAVKPITVLHNIDKGSRSSKRSNSGDLGNTNDILRISYSRDVLWKFAYLDHGII